MTNAENRGSDANARLDFRDPDWVAQQLGIDKNAVYKYLNDGVLPGLQLGRKWLISETSLIQFLKEEERKQTHARRTATDSAPPQSLRYGRFSEEARQLLSLAQDTAKSLNHNYIGTEHMLLALAATADCLGMVAIANLGFQADAVQPAVMAIIAPQASPSLGSIGLTPRAKRVTELAIEQAELFGSDMVASEHLALGLIAEGEGIAAGIMESAGITLEKLQAEVRRLLETGSSAEEPTQTTKVSQPRSA